MALRIQITKFKFRQYLLRANSLLAKLSCYMVYKVSQWCCSKFTYQMWQNLNSQMIIPMKWAILPFRSQPPINLLAPYGATSTLAISWCQKLLTRQPEQWRLNWLIHECSYHALWHSRWSQATTPMWSWWLCPVNTWTVCVWLYLRLILFAHALSSNLAISDSDEHHPLAYFLATWFWNFRNVCNLSWGFN